MKSETVVLTFMIIFASLIPAVVAIGKPDLGTMRGHITVNADDIKTTGVGEYPDDWNCVDISNSYMSEHPDWCILEIHVEGAEVMHAVNYKIVDDRLYVHDEAWGIEYEFTDWKNLTLYKYRCGVEAPQGIHNVSISNGFVVESVPVEV